MDTRIEALNRVGRIQNELDAAMNRVEVLLQDVGTDASGRARHNDPDKAALSRELLRAQDLTRLMQSELSTLYWNFKGYGDPREETLSEQTG